jgi:secondary thiamine-phosphate synthase enzyme
MIHQQTLEFRTRGRGTQEVTAELQRAVAACGIRTGVATVFLQHTSASLVLCENADPDVRRDLETHTCRVGAIAGSTYAGLPNRGISGHYRELAAPLA